MLTGDVNWYDNLSHLPSYHYHHIGTFPQSQIMNNISVIRHIPCTSFRERKIKNIKDLWDMKLRACNVSSMFNMYFSLCTE